MGVGTWGGNWHPEKAPPLHSRTERPHSPQASIHPNIRRSAPVRCRGTAPRCSGDDPRRVHTTCILLILTDGILILTHS